MRNTLIPLNFLYWNFPGNFVKFGDMGLETSTWRQTWRHGHGDMDMPGMEIRTWRLGIGDIAMDMARALTWS
jgi:hypothetical protein